MLKFFESFNISALSFTIIHFRKTYYSVVKENLKCDGFSITVEDCLCLWTYIIKIILTDTRFQL